MQFNVGKIDQILRILSGTILIVLTATHIMGFWVWIGIILLMTGVFRFCPTYFIFKVKSK